MKKIKRLILHIGTIKTGSSSIQQSFGKGRDTLLEHNIFYPDRKPYNHTFSFKPLFVNDPQKSFLFNVHLNASEDKHAKVENYRKTWVREITSCGKDNFIVSAEGLTVPTFPRKAVKRLKTFVDQYFEKVVVIAYVRHYDQWISSRIQQAIRNSDTTMNIQELVDHLLECPPSISYKQSLQKWVKVFGRENLVVRPFDPKTFYNGSLLSDFFQAVGLPADEISIPEIRSNESIGKHGVAFLQKYNEAYPLFIDGKINIDRGSANNSTVVDMYRNVVDEKFRLKLMYTPEQVQRFNEEIDYVNQFFTDGYQFHQVSPGRGEIEIPNADDIPVEFFVELINNYNKKIRDLQEQIEAFLRSLIFIWKILEIMRFPLVLSFLNKLPFLKGRFERIIFVYTQYSQKMRAD